MRLIGRDKATEFLAEHRHAPWRGDLRAFLCELASCTWTDVADLKRDYPDACWERPMAVFQIAGARVLVFCKIILERSLILLQRFELAESVTVAERKPSENAA